MIFSGRIPIISNKINPTLDSLLDSWLVVVSPLDLLTFSVSLDASLAMKLSQTTEVQFRPLGAFNLADMDIFQRINMFSLFGNIAGDGVLEKVLDQVLDIARGNRFDDQINHQFPDLFNLVRLSVGGGFLLLSILGGETNDKHAEMKVVSSLDVNVSRDHGVLLPDHFAVFVTGEAHAVEVGEAVFALDIFADQTELTEGVAVVSVEVVLVDVVDASFETVSGNFVTDGFGDEGFADLPLFEHVGGFDVVPVLFGEGVDNLLLATLFGLGSEPFVLADGHFVFVRFFFL